MADEDLITDAVKAAKYIIPKQFHDLFDERELKQIAFSQMYVHQFNHGADGHNNMRVINKLVLALQDAQEQINTLCNETTTPHRDLDAGK